MIKKTQDPAGTGHHSSEPTRQNLPPRSPRPNTKLHTVLEAFAQGGSYHRFEAERLLHDHALHSTVSEIQQRYSITIKRRMETVTGHRGAPTRVMRYWLDDTGQETAKRLLGLLIL